MVTVDKKANVIWPRTEHKAQFTTSKWDSLHAHPWPQSPLYLALLPWTLAVNVISGDIGLRKLYGKSRLCTDLAGNWHHAATQLQYTASTSTGRKRSSKHCLRRYLYKVVKCLFLEKDISCTVSFLHSFCIPQWIVTFTAALNSLSPF